MEKLNSVLLLPSFIRKAKTYLSEEAMFDLASFLAEHPEKGDLIPDTGGIRKLRWAREGQGKSTGYRIIYYFYSEKKPLFVITMYGKNEKSNLSQSEKNEMKKLTRFFRN